MKQAVTNITECGCVKSPVPTISCRSLQHKCFVHVVKIDLSFPCISITQKFRILLKSLSPPICMCVRVCVCVGGGGGFMCVREDRERERRGREPEGL